MSAKDQNVSADNLIGRAVPVDERVRNTDSVNNLFHSAYGDGQGKYNSGGDDSRINLLPYHEGEKGTISLLPYHHGDKEKIDLLPYWQDPHKIIDLPPDNGIFDIPRDPFSKFPDRSDFQKPTDKEEQTAEGKLDKQIGGLISREDQKHLENINHAILTGDDKALAAELAAYKNDPKKLHAVVDEINRELKDAHAGVGLHMSAEGKVYAYRDDGHNAVEMDPKTGKVSGVRKIMVAGDGEVYIGDVNKTADPDKVMEHVANRAVNHINDDPFSSYHIDWNQILKDRYHQFKPVLLDAHADDTYSLAKDSIRQADI